MDVGWWRLRQWLSGRRREESVSSHRPERYPPGHYYSALPDLEDIQSRAATIFSRDRQDCPAVELRIESQRQLLRELSKHAAIFDPPQEPRAERRFHLQQSFFHPGDAFVLHAMLCHFRFSRIVEVGSGYTTALIMDTRAQLAEQVPAAITCIEPYPQRLRELLWLQDWPCLRLIEQPVQQVPLEVFDELQGGDLLLIDSSHVSKVGSGVNHLVFEVLPRLSAGVFIHFHDICWPFEYPEKWVMQGRAWNEAYLLRAFLQYNQAFQIVLFNNYIQQFTEFPEQWRDELNNSLWLRRAMTP